MSTDQGSTPHPGLTFLLGTAIEQQSQRYSSTGVSSRYNASGHLIVDSLTQHHQSQSLWIRSDKGNDIHHEFHDAHVPALRPGHRVLISYEKDRGPIRVENLATGEWRLLRPYYRDAAAWPIVSALVMLALSLVAPVGLMVAANGLVGVMLLVYWFPDRRWRKLRMYRTSPAQAGLPLLLSGLALMLPPMFARLAMMGVWFWTASTAYARRTELRQHFEHREALEQSFRTHNAKSQRSDRI